MFDQDEAAGQGHVIKPPVIRSLPGMKPVSDGEVSYYNGTTQRTEVPDNASEVKKSLANRPDNYRQMLKGLEPQDNETVCIPHSNLVFSGVSYVGQDFVIQDRTYRLTRTVRIPFIGELGAIGQYDTYVVSDKQYEQLKQNLEEMSIYGINILPRAKLPPGKNCRSENPDNLNSYVTVQVLSIGAFISWVW